MVNTGGFLAVLSLLAPVFASDVATRQSDPCAKVGGQKWVSPSDLRACFTSVPVDPVLKENVRLLHLCCLKLKLSKNLDH